jgi:type I restriction enzyme M protein
VFVAAGAGVKTDLLFFARGRPTERIWYYDLSDRKVGKKTPLTIEDFADFFARVQDRTDSEKSWAIDFTARRRKAADDAKPFRDVEAHWKTQAEALRATLSALKKEKIKDDTKIQEAEIAFDAANHAARDAATQAQSIEDAVYDLKAVNPNKKAEVDIRTPAELLALIESKGREVTTVLAALRAMA